MKLRVKMVNVLPNTLFVMDTMIAMIGQMKTDVVSNLITDVSKDFYAKFSVYNVFFFLTQQSNFLRSVKLSEKQKIAILNYCYW